MSYSYESLKKAIAYLKKETPHDMNAFKTLYQLDQNSKMPIHEVLLKNFWSKNEKEQLLKLYQYDLTEMAIKDPVIKDIGEEYGMSAFPYIDLCIREVEFFSFEVLLEMGAPISVATIPRIITYIKEPQARSVFCISLIRHFIKKKKISALIEQNGEITTIELDSLCDPYVFETKDGQRKMSSLKCMVDSKAYSLISLFFDMVKNKEELLHEIIRSNDPKLVESLLKRENEFKEDQFQRGIYQAIDQNNLEIIKILLNINPKLMTEEIISYAIEQKTDQYKERLQIVMYLSRLNVEYFKKVDYTGLISLAIKAEEKNSVIAFITKAIKNGKTVHLETLLASIEPLNEKKENASFLKFLIGEIEFHAKNLFGIPAEDVMELLLKKIIEDFYLEENYDLFIEEIKRIIKYLPKENISKINAIFYVPYKKISEITSLGFSIQAIHENDNILMHYMKKNDLNESLLIQLKELIEKGADINYESKATGENVLSTALSKIEAYNYNRYISFYNWETSRLKIDVETIERERKEIVYFILDKIDDKRVTSKSVKKELEEKIKPGFTQVIYRDLLSELSKRGLKVSDDYFKASIHFFDFFEEPTNYYCIPNPWEQLWNFYQLFENQIPNNRAPFPCVEKASQMIYQTQEAESLYQLILEHLKRNFVTKESKIIDIDKGIGNKNAILKEISRYLGFLDDRYILRLILEIPILTPAVLTRYGFLEKALMKNCVVLSRDLIRNGVRVKEDTFLSNEISNLYEDLLESIKKEHKETKELLTRIKNSQKKRKKEKEKCK